MGVGRALVAESNRDRLRGELPASSVMLRSIQVGLEKVVHHI